MKDVFINLLIAGFSIFFCTSSQAQESLQLEDPLTFAGSSLLNTGYEIIIDDTIGYVGMADGLFIFTLGDLTAPDTLASLYLSGGRATELAKAGHYLYVSTVNGIFYAINITDLQHPVVADSITLPIASLWAAADIDSIRGYAFMVYNYLYGTSGDNGILIIDISNPYSLNIVKTIITDNALRETDYENYYLYAVGSGKLVIYDVSEPENVHLISETFTEIYQYFPVELYVIRDTVYISDLDGAWPAHQSALSIFDATDKENPRLIGRQSLNKEIGGVYAWYDTVAIGNGLAGVQFYQVSPDSANPDSLKFTSLGVAATPGYANNFAIQDSILYVPDYGWEIPFKSLHNGGPLPGDFLVYNIRDMSNPQLIGYYNMPAPVENVILGNKYLYALNGTTNGYDLTVLKIWGPNQIEIAGKYNTTGSVSEAAEVNDTLLLIGGSAGLEMVNVADPANIYEVRKWSTSVLDIVVRDNYAYVAAASSGYKIFDIFDSSNTPLIILPTGSRAVELHLYHNYLYGADLDGGGRIFNVEEPENAFLVDSFGTGNMFNGLDISEDLDLLFMKGFQYFAIYDLSPNPEKPAFISSYGPFFWNYDIKTVGHYIINADGWDGVKVIDIIDPVYPTLVQTWNTSGFVYATCADSSYLYVADMYGFILLHNGIATDIEEPDADIQLPKLFSLHQNYPNPFNPITTIEFELARRGYVTLTIYNILGREVTVLVNKEMSAGRHQVKWDATSSSGNRVASGIYFYRLNAQGHEVVTKKMLLLK